MKTRFTEEQIIGVLKEAGANVADLCRKHGISDATYYNWKEKYGGMTVFKAQLTTLEWVVWFNHKRFLSSIGYVPPAAAEANYYNNLGQ